jgi:GNAT superfamily N-acetyltransferase
MQNTLNAGNRSIGNIKRRIANLLRIIFGKIYAYEEMIVLETSTQTNLKSFTERAWLKSACKSNLNVTLVNSADIPKFDRFQKFKGGRAGEKFKAGHLCFIAEKNGKIVNYTWIAFHEAYIDEIERKITIGPCSAYIYDEFTDPEYRGMGILPTVLMNASDYLYQNGIKEIYELVGSNNYPSLRSHQKTGSRKMGKITLLRMFGQRKYTCKGETPEDLYKLKQMFST